MKMNLQWFTDYTVTVYNDGNFSATTASPSSGAKDTEVTLTITPNSNKELDVIEVVSGGVTVNQSTKKFTIGTANVVLFVKGKSSKRYKVTENTYVNVNGTAAELTRNMKLEQSATGAIVGVTCEGTEIALTPAVQNLIDAGVLIKM